MITPEVCQDILPYYAISTHGRVMNVNSGKIMKPNYRTNGYEYYCLAADNCKNGQKKYNVHRIVMKTFCPVDNMDELEVNHINAIKSDNYINKVMPDGSIQSNLEWSTHQENTLLASQDGLRLSNKINFKIAYHIRKLHDEGYSYNQIKVHYYPNVSWHTIQNVCLNKVYYDPTYAKTHKDRFSTPSNSKNLTDDDAARIRSLFDKGYKYEEIRDMFYPSISLSTISDIVRGKTHKSNF